MLRQSSSRNYRSGSKKLIRPTRHTFQAVLLIAVGVWIVYHVAHGRRRAAVAVEDGGEAEARRRLGRKGLVVPGQVGSDDNVRRSQSDGWGAAADALNKDEDGDGDEEGQAADDEDDGADDEDDDDLDDDDEEDDDSFLLSRNGDSEDELKTLLGESDREAVFGNGEDDGSGTRLHQPKELDSSAVPLAKASGGVQDAAAVSPQRNATDGAVDKATELSDFPLKNAATLVNLLLHDRGTARDTATAKKLEANGFGGRAARAENDSAENGTAGSVTNGHGISS